MKGLVDVCEPFVGAVGRQRVLRQVVGSDAKEIDLRRERHSDQRSRRSLDYDAEADLLIAWLANRVQHCPHSAHLLDSRHHGQHDPDGVSAACGPVDRPQLYLQ